MTERKKTRAYTFDMRARASAIFELVRKVNESPCIAFRAVGFLRVALEHVDLAHLRATWDGPLHLWLPLTALEMLCLHTACSLESQYSNERWFGQLPDRIKVMIGCGSFGIARAQFDLCAAMSWHVYKQSPFVLLMDITTTDAEWEIASALIHDAALNDVAADPTVLALACFYAALKRTSGRPGAHVKKLHSSAARICVHPSSVDAKGAAEAARALADKFTPDQPIAIGWSRTPLPELRLATPIWTTAPTSPSFSLMPDVFGNEYALVTPLSPKRKKKRRLTRYQH